MKNTCPSYFKNFTCIADKCPDTCCNGWAIVVDPQSLEKYQKTDGIFGDKIRSVLAVDDDGDTVFTNIGSRCPFLLENGLCEMYIALGKDSLCRTCAVYPRHISYFGARKETGLSLSCPEAARLIMQNSNPITFEETDEAGEIQPNSIDPAFYFTLLKARKTAINIVQNRKYPIEQRLIALLRFTAKLNEAIRSSEDVPSVCESDYSKAEYKESRAKKAAEKYFSDLMNLEKLRPEWNETLATAKSITEKDLDEFRNRAADFEYEAEHFAVYLIFRYFMTAAYDGDILTKIRFTVAASVTVPRIIATCGYTKKEQRVTAAQKWSREVEHSALNMEALTLSMKKSKFYSFDNLINILSKEK